MRIEILGTESLGVRGLCCLVITKERKILIDPGVALGYLRHGQLPHPFQVAVGAMIRERIIAALADATDVVISHFHGDHVPLVDANPYQLPMSSVVEGLKGPRFWAAGSEGLSRAIRQRREAIGRACGTSLPVAGGKSEGPFCFSTAMPHGEERNTLGTVMMTRIEEDGFVFAHASDIQLLERRSITQLLEWKPDIVIASGPPLYLYRLSRSVQQRAWENGRQLAKEVPTLILDHHLLRSQGGIRWLDRLNGSTKNHVICAADYMGEKRRFLEAWRRKLYRELPVPEGWHKDYAHGRTDTTGYQRWRSWDVSKMWTPLL